MKTNIPGNIMRSSPSTSLLRLLFHADPGGPSFPAQANIRAAVGALLFLLTASSIVAAPVTRDEAFRAAGSQLPGFFPGAWRPAGEMALQNLSGDTAAYVFMFSNLPEPAKGSAPEETPAAFVARQRVRLAKTGQPVSPSDSELYGEDRFATVFTAADDTEPVVLRCFKGLPSQVVKEVDALALGAKSGAGAWRVRRCLMLGLFDEAFVLEPTSGTGGALVVDMRSRAVVTEEDAKARAKAKKALVPDSERIRMFQEAWAPYRTPGKAATFSSQPVRPPKTVASDEVALPSLPAPKSK
jgi:hypothetical protein